MDLNWFLSNVNQRYSALSTLNAHVKFSHNKDGQLSGVVCEFCGKTFVSRGSLQSHVQTIHEKPDDQKVQFRNTFLYLSITFFRSLQFFSHQFKFLHIFIQNTHKCSMCSASFINKHRLKKHVDTIHLGEPVKCSLCDKISPNTAALVFQMNNRWLWFYSKYFGFFFYSLFNLYFL